MCCVVDEEVKGLDQDDWQFVPVGEQQNFGIRTTFLEDKATACQMLVCYARELKHAFAPYVEEVCKIRWTMRYVVVHTQMARAIAIHVE